MRWVVCSAAKYAVDDDSLSNELQQLGLPKGVSALVRCWLTGAEHAAGLCKAYSDKAAALSDALKASTFRGEHVVPIAASLMPTSVAVGRRAVAGGPGAGLLGRAGAGMQVHAFPTRRRACLMPACSCRSGSATATPCMCTVPPLPHPTSRPCWRVCRRLVACI